MLREFFPCSDEGAALYGGFLKDPNYFCKTYPATKSLEELLIEINKFLEANGYENFDSEEFDVKNMEYRNEIYSISTHGNLEELVLLIAKENTSKSESELLINQLIKFRNERNWEQFHNPKDLALAINIEAGELLELFLWKNADEANTEKVKEELADIMAYSLLLADKYKFNIEEIVLKKIRENGVKYPVDKAKGNAKKYNEL